MTRVRRVMTEYPEQRWPAASEALNWEHRPVAESWDQRLGHRRELPLASSHRIWQLECDQSQQSDDRVIESNNDQWPDDTVIQVSEWVRSAEENKHSRASSGSPGRHGRTKHTSQQQKHKPWQKGRLLHTRSRILIITTSPSLLGTRHLQDANFSLLLEAMIANAT